ncbi:MAG: hypothetical protein P8Y00_02450, partial [Deltaproteobacteria bacterium]
EKTFFPFQGFGLVFSVTYPRGILAPSAFHPSGWLRFPPKIRHEKDSALSASLMMPPRSSGGDSLIIRKQARARVCFRKKQGTAPGFFARFFSTVNRKNC